MEMNLKKYFLIIFLKLHLYVQVFILYPFNVLSDLKNRFLFYFLNYDIYIELNFTMF